MCIQHLCCFKGKESHKLGGRRIHSNSSPNKCPVSPPEVQTIPERYSQPSEMPVIPVNEVENARDIQGRRILDGPIGGRRIHSNSSPNKCPVSPPEVQTIPERYSQPSEVPVIPVNEVENARDIQGRRILDGPIGTVYYFVLQNGRSAAIKKMDSRETSPEEFFAKVSTVSRLKHENVVELLGYCADGDFRALAFEYATDGSLCDILHGQRGGEECQSRRILSWEQRVKIVVGAAKGLKYLHEIAQPCSVHGNIKSSNILIFNADVAKIADFNLSDVGVSTAVLGSFGNEAPEYVMTEQHTQKGDVYSFGVLIIELLTGRKPIDITLPTRQQSLVLWATPNLVSDKVEQCVDQRLRGDYPRNGVAKMAAVARRCLEFEVDHRPNMSYVVEELKPLLEIRGRG